MLLLTKSFKIVVSLEQHSCLADLGIRLRTLPFGTTVNDVVDDVGGCDATDNDGGGETTGCESTEVPIDGLGGLPDPGHLADHGP